jgi:hypothetical protein
MDLIILENKYSVYKFNVGSVLPDWIYASEFYSITRTPDEISVVALQTEKIPENVHQNKNRRIIKVIGPLDFSIVGIIADLSSIFKRKNISIFTVSTFETDYILVSQDDLNAAMLALVENGHTISVENKKASE